MKHWFTFTNKADDPSVVDIHIIDIIGDWMNQMMNEMFGESITVTAKAFVDQLAALPATVKALRVHINSPGGDVQAAVNIANALREQQVSKGRVVETIVDGIAASSASIIAMAGSVVRIADNALVMIHNPMTVAVGNAGEMRKMADVLDTIRGQIVATYRWHSTLAADAIEALMDAETWMDADEAIASGFATEKIAGLTAAAALDPRGLTKMKIPDKFRAQVEALVAKPAPTPAALPPAAALDVIRQCRDGECLDLAESLIATGATLVQVEDAIRTATETRAAAAARATVITAICATAKLPNLAAGYVASAMDTAAVKTHLALIVPLRDSKPVDGSLSADGRQTKTSGGASVNHADIYAARNAAKKE